MKKMGNKMRYSKAKSKMCPHIKEIVNLIEKGIKVSPSYHNGTVYFTCKVCGCSVELFQYYDSDEQNSDGKRSYTPVTDISINGEWHRIVSGSGWQG